MAYMDAKVASEAAAEAEEVTAAVEARVMADAASANAVMYAKTASEKSIDAEAAAVRELMIDGKTKSVGDTSITVGTPMTSVTTTVDSKPTPPVVTGEIDKITAMSDAVDAVAAIMPVDAVLNECRYSCCGGSRQAEHPGADHQHRRHARLGKRQRPPQTGHALHRHRDRGRL